MQNDMRLWDEQVSVGGCVVAPPGSLRASRVGARRLQTTNGTKTFSFLALQSCGLFLFVCLFLFFRISASWTWSVNATVLPLMLRSCIDSGGPQLSLGALDPKTYMLDCACVVSGMAVS